MQAGINQFLVRFVFATGVMAFPALAQEALPAEERKAAVDGIVERLRTQYSVPELGEAMAARLLERASQGAYANLARGEEFAARLTKDLAEVGRDGHLRVRWSAEKLPPETPGDGDSRPPAEEIAKIRARQAESNFGIAGARVLEGNIGYIETRYFTMPEFAAETYAAAFQVVANTEALIIDLRANRGSMSPEAIPFFCGYLLRDATHLIDMYWRPTGKTRQSWSYAWVPGQRYLDKPVYLLTSQRTFSGAEEFAYDLKHLKRATVVGETTGGGANPGGPQRVTDHISVWLPVGRVSNAVTGGNWEGVGVKPDVEVPAAEALDAALRLIGERRKAAGAQSGR
ncbi:MAG: S41 family peptidase [Acidobacteria bacterium]|nr:S41 family peptidase [Acidobacteriota bacterium]